MACPHGMKRIFIYEFITGGGRLASKNLPEDALLCEATAMVAALAADFSALKNMDVCILRDKRLGSIEIPNCRVIEVANSSQETRMFTELAAESDWTVVIAPEFEQLLYQRCQQVIAAGGRLLGPEPGLVRLASDKHVTAERLSDAGIATPYGTALNSNQRLPKEFPYPAVLKPSDGAGSLGLRRIESYDAVPLAETSPVRLEQYCPGIPASISILGGAAGRMLLPPCRQRLSNNGRFEYLGGSLPLPAGLEERSRRLAEHVLEALPAFVGYLGIDLVLGTDATGDQDFVIEINPRLTTSYIGLRAAAKGNISSAMLELAQGSWPSLSFDREPIEFDACGSVRRLPVLAANERE